MSNLTFAYRGFMMNQSIFAIILLSILLIHIPSGYSQAQPVRGGGITNVRLEAGTRNVSERKVSTQEVPLGNISNSSISRDGKVIVTNGRIIRLDTPAPSEIPIQDATHIGYRLNKVDQSGSVVAYGLQNWDYYSIKLLSANTGIFMVSHDIRKQSDFDALFRLDISENASTIAYTHYNANRNGKNEIFVTEKSGEQYSRPILLDEVEVVQKPMQISSAGDRLYYHATVLDNASNTVTYSFVVRKTGRTWSKPEPIRINTNRPAWLFIHLINLVEYENRILVAVQWAWNYITHNRGARLITGDVP